MNPSRLLPTVRNDGSRASIPNIIITPDVR